VRLLVARLTKELLLPSAELASHPLVARMAEALRADSDRDVLLAIHEPGFEPAPYRAKPPPPPRQPAAAERPASLLGLEHPVSSGGFEVFDADAESDPSGGGDTQDPVLAATSGQGAAIGSVFSTSLEELHPPPTDSLTAADGDAVEDRQKPWLVASAMARLDVGVRPDGTRPPSLGSIAVAPQAAAATEGDTVAEGEAGGGGAEGR